MARQLRIEYEGALYHVTSRGNARQKIYQDDEDRKRFLEILEETVERFRWYCHAFCLMGNHYHLLIETSIPNLSLGMRHLNGVYTQKYNRRHKKVGHLFQGRYKSIHVEKDNYLLELSRYIVLNPVRAKMVKNPEEWPWSSYRATVGIENNPVYLWIDWILSQFGKSKRTAMEKYKEYVEEGIKTEEKVWDRLRGQIYLGGEDFINLIRGKGKDEDLEEIPRDQHNPIKTGLQDIFTEGGTAKEIGEAQREGYKMREMAKYLGLHYSTLTQRVRRAYKD